LISRQDRNIVWLLMGFLVKQAMTRKVYQPLHTLENSSLLRQFQRHAKQDWGKILWQVCRSGKSDLSTPSKNHSTLCRFLLLYSDLRPKQKPFHNSNTLVVSAPTPEMPVTCFLNVLRFYRDIAITQTASTCNARCQHLVNFPLQQDTAPDPSS